MNEINDEKSTEKYTDDELINDIISPINISITDALPIQCNPLNWLNYEVLPEKMEMINTGQTIMLIGKWQAERPYIESGSLQGKYIFSQLHFHWGSNILYGSEHTMDGERYPLEMHVVHFKKDYLFPDDARNFNDGIVIATYIIKVKQNDNENFRQILNKINEFKPGIKRVNVKPVELSNILHCFENDYFMYYGKIQNESSLNTVKWLISRKSIVISENQANSIRSVQDESGKCINENSQNINSVSKLNGLFFVNPSNNQYSTLYRF